MREEVSRKEVSRKEARAGQSPQSETVLVTGATGFLGEYLVRRLVGKYRVLALGRNRDRGRRLEAYGAVFCPGDFTRRESCACYLKEADYVIHAGALSSVWGKWEDFYRTNVAGTDLIARLCREYGVRRLVYLSSPSIYTCREDRYEIREEDAPERNELNYYIRSKLMAEERIRWWNRKGLETVILRPRGLIGPGDTSLVPRLLRANQGVGIPLFNGGHNLVDLTGVENAALACELALTAKGASGGVFNITNGEPTEFRVLLERFLKAIGERPHYRRLPFGLVYGAAGVLEKVYGILGLSGEPPLTRYTVCTLGHAQTMDIRRAGKILGYRPEKTLEESIREYGLWWRGQQERKDHGGGNGNLTEKDAAGKGQDVLTRPGKVTEVKLYRCGSCVNDLSIAFQGMPREKRDRYGQAGPSACFGQHPGPGQLRHHFQDRGGGGGDGNPAGRLCKRFLPDDGRQLPDESNRGRPGRGNPGFRRQVQCPWDIWRSGASDSAGDNDYDYRIVSGMAEHH